MDPSNAAALFSGLGLPIALAVIALALIIMGIKVVPQGFEYTVERFGRYTRTLKPGLNLLVPFFDRVGSKLSRRETVLDVPSQLVITRDNASVQADGVVFYQVVDTARAAYQVDNLSFAILNMAMTNIRSVIGAMDLDEVLSKRDEISDRLVTIIDNATSPWGVKVTRIEIKDLTPPADLVQAMARQMKAERERRADILEAEGQKQASILKAEGQKQAAVLQAEGRREAAFREAEARERLASAEAEATRMVSEAIGNGNVQAINYFIAQKYVAALESLASAPNQRVILLPMESTGILGSIAGVAELAKAAFAQGTQGPTGTPPKAPPSAPSAAPKPGPWQ
jgi:regulator of protease activity HflC (stomatin/prohibitin superfamily)